MWPVQTLTLLLCLTEEEQLFAQKTIDLEPPPAVEAVVPEEQEAEEETAAIFPAC
ncbi:MAG: hypothetical protein RBT71_08135 [Flavobacteriales bacterium]|jgi:hypothetical protein|nr:hypothetical protein [Flavobacteriales bacterium]